MLPQVKPIPPWQLDAFLRGQGWRASPQAALARATAGPERSASPVGQAGGRRTGDAARAWLIATHRSAGRGA